MRRQLGKSMLVPGWRPFMIAAVLGLLALPVAAQPPGDTTAAAPTAESSDLRQQIDSLFRSLQLRHGVLLEPREDMDGVETIEVSDGTLAVDGETVSVPELRAILGDAAEPVLRLYDAGEEGRAALFGGEVEAPRVDSRKPPRRPRVRRRPRSDRESRVVLGSSVTVHEGETVQEVVVFAGDVRVRGVVEGEAAAIGGSTWVYGEVRGTAISVGGSVHLGPGAVVRGDAVSVGGRVLGSEHATVEGEVVEVAFSPSFGVDWWPGRHGWNWGGRDWFHFSPMAHMWGLAWNFFGFVLLVLLAFLAVLLAAGPIERIGWKIKTEPWKAGLVGLLFQVLFVPLLCLVVIILAVSIVGIPLLLLVPFGVLALVVGAFLGFVAMAHQLGRWTEERFGWNLSSPYVAVLAGLAILYVWSLFGNLLNFGGPIRIVAFMFLGFGALVKYLGWTVGLGAALMTRVGTADDWRGGTHGVADTPPLPPAQSPEVPENPIEPGEAAESDQGQEEES